MEAGPSREEDDKREFVQKISKNNPLITNEEPKFETQL